MNRLTSFIYKKFLKLSVLFPLVLMGNESLIILILLLIIVYLQKSSKIFKSLNKKMNRNDDIEIIEENINKNVVHNEKEINNENKDKSVDSATVIEEKKNLEIKSNIQVICKKKKKNLDDKIDNNPYPTNKRELNKNYTEKPENHDFLVNVNQTVCSTPVFSLRTYKNIDFYFNFLIHDYDSKKIHNLIMCKDIHKWMSSSSLSDDDIANELVPVYFCLKNNETEVVNVYEYLKIFINSTEDGKIAFVQKGNDYNTVEHSISCLINNDIIMDLLDTKSYTNYNLSTNEGVNDFLNRFLSLVLISESSIGDQVKFDIKNYYENRSTYEYFFNTVNADSSIFNTSL